MRRICLIAVLISLNFLFAQQNLPEKQADLLEKGQEYLRSGSYDMARRSLEDLAELSGGKAGQNPLFEVYRLTGEYEKALAVANDMDKERGKLLAGEILLELGRDQQAKEAFLEAYALNPDNVRIRFDMGYYYYLHGQRDKYIEYFDGIFEDYDPYREDYTAEELTFTAKACRLYAMKSSDVDRSDTLSTIVNSILPDAISKDKYYYPAYREMIDALLEAFNMPDSLATIQDALNLNPNHPEILTAQATYQLQVLYRNLRPKAVSTLEYVLSINPRQVEALDLQATIHLSDEEYEKAEQSLQKALAVNPHDLTTMSLMAGFYYMQGRKTAFDKQCQAVLEINPNYGELYYTVARMVLHKRKFAESVAFDRKAIEMDPYLWGAYIELGRNLLNIGKEEEAKKYLDLIQEEYNFHVQSYNTRLLLEKYKEFKVYQNDHFRMRLHISEAEAMEPIVEELLENAYRTLTKRFHFEPENPTVFEMFPSHKDFSVRTIGLDTIGASGACFGRVVTVGSPGAMPLGTNNWASVVWHEFTHVITLQMTDYQVPRWFTEGLSEYSEQLRNPTVDRRLDLELYSAYNSGRMRKIADLNAGFTRPRYPGEVVLCYYQAKLVCEFIDQKHGFAKILEMLDLYRRELKDREVFERALSISLEEFDRIFLAWLQETIFSKMNVFPTIDESEMPELKDRIFIDPKDVEAYVKLSLGYLQQRKYTDVEIYAGKLLSLAPNQSIGYDVLGFLAYQRGNAKQARTLLEEAAKRKSKNFYTHWCLGMLYMHRFKNKKRAIACFKKAKASYPAYVRANNPYQMLADIYFSQGKNDKAFVELELYLQKQGNDFKTRINLARKYIELKRYQDALPHLQNARDIYPMDLGVNDLLAQCYMFLEEWKQAESPLKTALALCLDKTKSKFCGQLAKVYFQLEQREKSRKYAQKALELDQENEDAKNVLQKLTK